MYFKIIYTYILGGIFHFYSNFDRAFCKQPVETLIRRRIGSALSACFPQKDARPIRVKYCMAGNVQHQLQTLQMHMSHNLEGYVT